ncbi:MAG TPA: hypothetical protein PKE63_02850 [Lacibacter sp.]|nr:hypothetical protein [Lacibacter sp.]
MNVLTTQLLTALLNGCYLYPAVNHSGKVGYKLYEGNQVPLRFYKNHVVLQLHRYSLLKESHKKLVISRRSLQKLHGGNTLKKVYITHLKTSKLKTNEA